ENASGRRCRAEDTGRRGRVEAARVMRGRIERLADAYHDLIAGNDGGERVAPAGPGHFRGCKCGGADRGTRMGAAGGKRVVEVERVAEHAVEERFGGRRVVT